VSHSSKRFSPSWWTERLIPVLMIAILLGLMVTLLVTALAMLGLTPSF
jgi:hypothetical protein